MHDDILRKVRSLLRLSQSANAHEARLVKARGNRGKTMIEIPKGYTPGPWFAGSEGWISNSTRTLIAETIYDEDDRQSDEEYAANAALIALAPELAESCIRLAAEVERLRAELEHATAHPFDIVATNEENERLRAELETSTAIEIVHLRLGQEAAEKQLSECLEQWEADSVRLRAENAELRFRVLSAREAQL